MPIAMIALGVGAGILSGIFGIGGGVLIVPTLAFLLGVPQQTASAMSLVALLLPVGAFGVWEYYRSGKISIDQIGYGLLIALGIILGTYIGARLAMPVSDVVLKKGFAIFLLFVALRFWFS
jgi:uncharacterized membrane protein YfcA